MGLASACPIDVQTLSLVFCVTFKSWEVVCGDNAA